MAKININFNETNYSIDEANLAPATDALKAHLETLGGGEGGFPEYGTDWKFKEEISAQAFEEIFAAYPEDIYYGISIGRTEKWTISVTRATNENGFFGNLITLPENKAVYFITCQDSDAIDDREYACFDGWTEAEFTALNEALAAMYNEPAMIKGWHTRDYKKNEFYASSAPVISSVPESFTEIDLELLSAFFSTAGGDLDITLDGAVYKVDSTKLAPATSSLIAHIETLKGGEGGDVVELGKEYQFKDAEAMTAIEEELGVKIPISSLNYIANEGWHVVFACFAEPVRIFAVDKESELFLLADIDANPLFSYNCKDFTFKEGEVNITVPRGWYAGELLVTGIPEFEFINDTTVICKTIEPPTVLFPTAQEDFDTKLTMEQISLFFDLGGSDTTITINGVEYLVDSAKLADAKSALAAHLKALEDASN